MIPMTDRLNREARKTLRSMQTSVPVHVVPMANKFGVEMFKNHTFADELSGLIKKNEAGDFEIHVNSNHPITRQRFTMAHELAHFLLHRDKIGDGVVDDYLYRSKFSSVIEREANELAAEILMPAHLLISDEFKHLSIPEQAARFWVSEVSMDIRLGRLL